MAQQDVENTSSTTSDQAATRQTQNKKRRLDYELQGHLSSLGFTSNKIPTVEMINDAYTEAMTLDAIQLYEGVRVTLGIDEIAKLRRESDERREAYTNSFMYIKAAIHAKTTEPIRTH